VVSGQGISYKPCVHKQSPAFRSCILPWSRNPLKPEYNRGVDHMVDIREDFEDLTAAEPPKPWSVDQSAMDVDGN
jgi:hypothetical protein